MQNQSENKWVIVIGMSGLGWKVNGVLELPALFMAEIRESSSVQEVKVKR